MWVDSHCHLNFDDFGFDVDEVIKRARLEHITTLLTICCKLEEAPDILKIAHQDPQIFCTVGVHPHEAQYTLERLSPTELRESLKAFAQDGKVVGLGECGLDYYYNHSPPQIQKECFQAHLETAQELNLPLSIHTREAETDTISWLRSIPVRGVIHCFTGTQTLAEAVLELGFYISVSGIITFPKAEALREVIKTVPLNRLLLETDAPFLAPVPHRGKRNESSFLRHTAQCLTTLKEISLETLAHQTTENFFRLFDHASHPHLLTSAPLS